MSPTVKREIESDDPLAVVCHKLRTPLTAALGFIQLSLRDRTVSEAQVRNLQMVDEQLRRMSRLIDEFAQSGGTEPLS